MQTELKIYRELIYLLSLFTSILTHVLQFKPEQLLFHKERFRLKNWCLTFRICLTGTIFMSAREISLQSLGLRQLQPVNIHPLPQKNILRGRGGSTQVKMFVTLLVLMISRVLNFAILVRQYFAGFIWRFQQANMKKGH